MEKLHYDRLIERRRRWYKTIGKIYCSCLEAEVVFNSQGFRHILYDGEGRPRSLQDRIRRLNLLPLAIPIIKRAREIHERRVQGNAEFLAFRKYYPGQKTWITVVIKKYPSGKMCYLSTLDRR